MVTYPEDWDVVEFGSKCNITSSKRVFEREWTRTGIPFLRTRDIASFHSGEEQKDKLFISEDTYREKVASSGEPQKGDLLVTGVGTIGLPFLVDTDEKMYFKDGNILWMKTSEFFDPKWLYLIFMSKDIQSQIKDNSGFTTVGTFTIKNAKKLRMPLPSVPEQKEIASTLSCFDTYIDDLAELIEKKKGIRDGALEDLMSGRTRLEGFDGEWEYVEIKKAYKRLKGTPITAGQMHLIDTKTGDVRIFAGGATEVRAKETDLKDANIIDVPVVIVQSRGVIDFIYCEERCTFKNEMWGYTATDVYAVKFLYYYLKHNVEYFRNAGDGRSSFSQISLPVTEKYEIPFISPTEQRAIVSVLTAMDEEIETLETERDKMIQIREGAMDDLLTGRVRLTV